jgi:hypothetical protein
MITANSSNFQIIFLLALRERAEGSWRQVDEAPENRTFPGKNEDSEQLNRALCKAFSDRESTRDC